MKKAFITGISGQDGTYLTEFLVSKNYVIHGFVNQPVDLSFLKNVSIGKNLFIHYGDLSDPSFIDRIICKVDPNEIYNFAAQSNVKASFDMPEYTANITGLGALRILETIRRNKLKAKFYQASSSEMFGSSVGPQNEKTVFSPQSPYAISKLYAYWMTVNYREAYDIFACSGILFNHESPRRGDAFVTKQIANRVANVILGKQKTVEVGNLNASRDWGFAPEYVEMMWKMLQLEKPEDFVIGSGQSHTVRDLVQKSFEYIGLEIEWSGDGLNEHGIIKYSYDKFQTKFKRGDTVVKVNPEFFRPVESNYLHGDIAKARAILDWEPKVTFGELVKIMMDDALKSTPFVIGESFNILNQHGFNYINHSL